VIYLFILSRLKSFIPKGYVDDQVAVLAIEMVEHSTAVCFAIE